MTYSYIQLQAFGGPEQLLLKQAASLPEPGRAEIRVKVLAAGTGFTDTIIREGKYPGVAQKPPFIPGYDWVGVVDKCGPGATAFRIGQMVADMSVIGAYTQYLCVDESRVVACAEGLDAAEAVCMILPYTTALQMLTRYCNLQPGDQILVHAAGGAVGTALLQLARQFELTVYATASPPKHELLRQLGAVPIDYSKEDFVARTLELSGGGVDAVFDCIGAGVWPRSYRCLRRGGHLVAFGALRLSTGEESLARLLWGFARLLVFWRLRPDSKKSSFYNIQSRRERHPEQFKQDVARLMGWLQQGYIRPVIAARAPLRQAGAIHRQIDRAELQGRAVLMCQMP
jgi:NADPH:quinone reductase-like Zn-dependent oxidoreductase